MVAVARIIRTCTQLGDFPRKPGKQWSILLVKNTKNGLVDVADSA